MTTQIFATVEKILKEFLRDKIVLFFTFALPVFFLIVLPILYQGAPSEIVSKLKGSLSVTMVSFLTMVAGYADLSGSIASDRERGLYQKIASMPVKPWMEGVGRSLGVWALSSIGALIVISVGLVYGAEFNGDFIVILKCIGLFMLVAIASAGIGLIIASLVKAESAATHAGVAITLLTAFLGGMFLPYSMLPPFLQSFARVYPVSSANASMVSLLQGQRIAGYDPLNTPQIGVTILLSCFCFVLGLALYARRCWRTK